MLQDFPNSKKLNTNILEWSAKSQPLLSHINDIILSNGFGFHPTEFMVIQTTAQPICSYTNESYKSNEPTLTRHYKLSTDENDLISDTARKNRFELILQAENELDSPLTSPTTYTPTRFSFPVPSVNSGNSNSSSNIINNNNSATMNNMNTPITPSMSTGNIIHRPPITPTSSSSSIYARSGMDPKIIGRPPPPRPRPTSSNGSSLFISKPITRKPSLGTSSSQPSFLRPSGPARFNRPPLPNAHQQPRPTMRQDNATPRGFIKQSRVQMLDFNDATTLQENNTKAIDTAMHDLQVEKEERRQRLLEQKRLESEKRKLLAQQEKEKKGASKRRKSSKGNIAVDETDDKSTEDMNNNSTSPNTSLPTSPISPSTINFSAYDNPPSQQESPK
ncbi:hypothetical protein BJ944DRAFT_260622 [Cunninghamella echinulata]|nr:hypothetical protein BJ944DRAFT_260622 [Cunninghamella echinulata]